MLIAVIGAFLGYFKYTKTEKELHGCIDLGIRSAYIGLQVFLAIGGFTFLWLVGWLLLG
jgi:hypothetical protein